MCRSDKFLVQNRERNTNVSPWLQIHLALIPMMTKLTRTRIGGAHGGRPREGVVYHTAVCRVRIPPGRASYRTNVSGGLGHC